MAPSHTVIAQYALNGQMRSKVHTALTAPFGFTSNKDLQTRYEKIIINGQMRNKPFLIVIYHSLLVKAAMNAACICKMRNGVCKTISMSSLFQLSKAECVLRSYQNCSTIVN
jgi:hypothetical protein